MDTIVAGSKPAGKSKTRYTCISADSHLDLVWLPYDLFTKNATAQMKDRMPYVVESPDGPLWVSKKGAKFGLAGGVGSSGMKYTPGEVIRSDIMAKEGVWSAQSRDSHRMSDPEQRLKDQYRDGIEAEVIYGILKASHHLKDPEAGLEMTRIYNDFLIDFCKAYPERLLGLAVIQGVDVGMAVQEVRRVAKRGIKGIELSVTADMVPLFDRRWDALWQELNDNELPIHFHGTTMAFTWPARQAHWSNTEFAAANAMYVTNTQMGAAATLSAMIFGGQLERFPRLKVVFGESGIGWIPFFLVRMDYQWEEQFRKQLDLKLRPSDYWQRQCRATFQYDVVGAKLIDFLGEHTIMWASDFPHPQGVWPDSQEYIQKQFGDLPEHLRHKIICGNAVTTYRLG
jgi:predicted TIM-barrel fold metal-dependent hydrolase